MPFIPHTEQEIQSMLQTIGVSSIEQLFDEIPQTLRQGQLRHVPHQMNEMSLTRVLKARAVQDEHVCSFLGAGAYEHHIPAAVWDIATRGEFMTAYTPYQAEASQGTLQLLYEYQTNMTQLTGMDVSNASLYDGASALAEAILMAVRIHKNSQVKRILLPQAVHPHYRTVAHTITATQGVELVMIPYDAGSGRTLLETLAPYAEQACTAIVIQQPNFFGVLEEVDVLTEWAIARHILVIAVVNPTSLALYKAPGEWGGRGVDIAVGEGQPLGVPLASGGPYYGFMCCRKEHVRQMPGRIIGRTVDKEGKPGYALTLQAREQHIRRSKATSNICTNQGLAVTASTIYMALVGAEGLRRIAVACHRNTQKLVAALTSIDGVTQAFASPFFHEVVLRLPGKASAVLSALAKQGITGGWALADYPDLGEAILVCATEVKTDEDIERYKISLEQALKTM